MGLGKFLKSAAAATWVQVDRLTDDLPATAAEALFNVHGGRVLVLKLIGEVTTIIQTQACNTKVTINPTTGTSGDVASNLDISADEVGTHYIVEGDGTALVGVNAGSGWSAVANPWIAPIGTIDLETAATNTGKVKWTILYIPIDDGAYVTATTP